ncbi:DUF1775 domain-containing protein [Pseudonocardia sp. MH-G8]|uniref:DUF1775 domain-containing protein n=1 Tax=Pseudonocardia sp. MH-G8 TaxID=1854588 RepID=UPI000BA151EE|nr:DUF1775 domain-containing protein [Pseudonocardia sp. MH-G8]OZM79331.1 hypothetical protein CFP66_26655 [Pseudonocardia sp. MH-G8]
MTGRRPPAARAVAAVLLPLLALLLGAARPGPPDGAGLVVEPDRVEPGARDVTLVFRMTDGAAPTVDLRLLLPTGRPLVGVTAPPPQGWTAELTTTTLPVPAPSADGPVQEAVSAVAWTATGPREPGTVDFTVHVELMPEGAGPVRFRAACTDAGGGTVEWTDSWADGGPEPAHRALELPLGATPGPPVAAGGHGHHHGPATGVPPTGAVTPSGVATLLAVVLAAVVALVALLVPLSRRQRRHLDPAPRGR